MRWVLSSLTLGTVVVLCASLAVLAAVNGEWISAVIAALGALVVGYLLLSTGTMMRRLDKVLDEVPDAPEGPPSEAMLAVDAFEEAIHNARGVPFTDQVRLGRGHADLLLDRLRMALPPGRSDLSSLVDRLNELIQRAKPIPLTDEIRVDRDDVYDIVDRMRASFAGKG